MRFGVNRIARVSCLLALAGGFLIFDVGVAGCGRKKSSQPKQVVIPAGTATGTTSSNSTSPTTNNNGPATTAVAANLMTPRSGHTASALPGGDVLVVGGRTNANTVAATAELYKNKVFTATTGTPLTPRFGHTATVLPGGKVFIAGGQSSAQGGFLNSTEIYDPATGRFTAGPNLITARSSHVAAPYTAAGQPRVLVAGGATGQLTAINFLATAESYDPTTGQITPVAAPMAQSRMRARAVTLANGNVLVHGGISTGTNAQGQQVVTVAGAEMFNAATGTFGPTGAVKAARLDAGLVLLGSGDALVIGGIDGAQQTLASAEVYAQAGGTFTQTAGDLFTKRSGLAAVATSTGQALAIGGSDGTAVRDTIEAYDATTRMFVAGPNMTSPRRNHTATLLPTGEILIIGGEVDLQGTTTATSELISVGTFAGPTGPAAVPIVAAPTTPTTPTTPLPPAPGTTPTTGLPTTGTGTAGGLGGSIGGLIGNLLGSALGGNQPGSPAGAFGQLFGTILGSAITGQQPNQQQILSGFANVFSSILNSAGGGGGTPVAIPPGFPGTVATPAPVLSQVFPASAAAGQIVTLTGFNFDPNAAGNAVTIGGLPAQVSQALQGAQTQQGTSGQLTVTVPFGLFPGPTQVAVTVNGQASNPIVLTVQ